MINNSNINPITSGNDVNKLLSINISELIKSYSNQFNIDIRHYFVSIKDLSLYECKKTGYKFFYPVCCGDEDFYVKLQVYPWYYQENKWEYDIALKEITKGELLEIGCGRGYFLQKLSINNIGLELNQDAINFCLGNNLNVINENFYNYSSKNAEKFDYIVSFQVLEHIPDIKLFFESCYHSLKKGGKLIIGVPNTNSLVFSPFSPFYYEHGSLVLNMPPHHIGWWTAKSLKYTAKYFGFEKSRFYFDRLPESRLDIVKKNIKSSNNKLKKNRIYLFALSKFRRFLRGDTMVGVFVKK